ncbi:hypothetical protein MML48_9g00021244 [Holotrichia oblita]|uniref:Uncharacterized protein n=1 Tax=Holotrichia oblita TaxID=644536 RepID=A0ACB9SKK5_HOLOL|nr:hypothetical protein MML48_9g00021244 [Holotrichia oblita]
MGQVVSACTIMHNMCLEANIALPVEEIVQDEAVPLVHNANEREEEKQRLKLLILYYYSKHHFWTTDNATRLIELYENYPCLYDAKSKNYHNRNLKVKALTEICDSLKELFPDKPFTEALIKSKIHTLRSQFMSEHNKIKKTEASGASPDDIYQPTLWCYQNLQFLEDACEVVTEGVSNYEPEQVSMQDSDADGIIVIDATVDELSTPFTLEDYGSPSTSTSRSASAASINREPPEKQVQHQSNVNKLPTPSKKSKKRKLEDEEYAGILKDCSIAISSLNRSTSPPVVEPKEDENSLFGKYITSEMNKIKNDDILDEFKKNVMQELYAAKKLFRQQLN